MDIPVKRRVIAEHKLLADDSCVSVAGLTIKAGQFATNVESETQQNISSKLSAVGSSAIARLVQLTRRDERLTREKYAMKVGSGLDELLLAESATRVPEPRVLHALSEAPAHLISEVDVNGRLPKRVQSAVREEVLRFAASSGLIDKLSKDESKDLRDLLRLLHDE